MAGWSEARARHDPDIVHIDDESLRRELERLAVLASRDGGILDAILNHSTQGVFVCDDSGELTLVSRAAERIWAGSATAETMAEWARYRAFHPDGRPLAPDEWSMARALRTGEAVEPEEVVIERFDGAPGVILMGAAPIIGVTNQVMGAVGIFADITALKECERHLLHRERRAATRLARLQALTAALSEAIGAHDVARVAVEHVLGAVGARDGALWTLREDGSVDLVIGIGGDPEQRQALANSGPGTATPLTEALHGGEPVWLASRTELEARYPGFLPPRSDVRAMACLPMKVKGQCIGAMSFAMASDRAFPEDDRSFLLVAVRHGAQALERARLYEAERRARAEAVAAGERSSLLYEASTVLASSLEYEGTLASVANLAVPRFADWCSVDLAEDLAQGRGPVVVAHKDPAKAELARELRRRYPLDPDAPNGPPAVVRTARSELYPDVTDDILAVATRGPAHLRVMRELGPRSAMVVPMVARGRTLGAITFILTEAGRRYGPADLEMAEHLARRAGLAIDNARLYAQAQDAVRAREDVVAVVSHDLKNPLNAILMSSGLLRRSATNPDRVRHHADAIERSVGRMRSLISELLDLALLESGRFTLNRQPHEIGAFVEEVIAVVQPLVEAKGLVMVAETRPACGARALCDRERTLQVLSNLVGNAVAFTPHGGRITVSARASGAEVVIAVSDTGPGISADDQRLVFERFWKSRSSGQGTGLGLSIAKGIVEAHGGRIWLESKPGAGATFLFTLPSAY